MRFLLLLSLLVGSLNCLSQGNTQPIKLDANSIIKDSAGTVYKYADIQPLMLSGKYSVRLINAKDPSLGFLLVRLSDEERLARLSRMPQPRPSGSFVTGAEVDNFNMVDMKGKRYKLKNLKGKVVVLNFWFINCPPCKMEIPELNELVNDYKDSSNIVFLAVALDEISMLRQFLKNTPFHYAIVDDGRSIAAQYNVTNYPTHLVIDKQGKALFHTTGLATNTIYWLRNSIKGALAE